MRNFIIILSCLFTTPIFSQNHYTDFLQFDYKIQWAAGYDQLLEITPKIKSLSIRQLLYQQMIKKEALKPIHTLHIDSFTTIVNPYRKYIIRDLASDESNFTRNEKKCSCLKNDSLNKFDVYKINQVLYYKDSRLYIKNLFITPLCLKRVIDSGEQFVWQSVISYQSGEPGDSLNVATKKKCIDLGNAEQIYDLRYDIANDSGGAKVFTLKNPIFSHHLFEDILCNKVTVVDERRNIIPYKKALKYRLQPIDVFFVDTKNGEGMGGTMIKKIYPEVNIDSFYEYAVNQHLYLDTAANILYSEVNYIDVYNELITSQGIDIGRTFHFRVYMIKPSLYKKTFHHNFVK